MNTKRFSTLAVGMLLSALLLMGCSTTSVEVPNGEVQPLLDASAEENVDSQAVDSKICRGDVHIRSYQDEDKVRGCTELRGSLYLSWSDYNAPSAADDLIKITGSLYIFYNDNLRYIEGFRNLESIGASLVFYGNASLESVYGFDALTSVGEDLLIANNSKLEFIDAYDFPSLEHTGSLRITQNPSLKNINWTDSITSIDGTLEVSSNAELSQLWGFAEVVTIGGVVISDNASLGDVQVLFSVINVSGDVEIRNNQRLHDVLVTDNVQAIAGSLRITENASLGFMGDFGSLGSIGQDFEISHNYWLQDIRSFPRLHTVNGDFYISNNFELRHISGLDTLHTINGTHKEIVANGQFDCTDYSSTSPAYFPLTASTGNDVDCGIVEEVVCLGDIVIDGTSTQQDIDRAESCTEIKGDLLIQNTNLQSLSFIKKLKKIGGSLIIQGNPSLFTVSDFRNLEYIRGDFVINGNPSLYDIQGFDKLKRVHGFYIASTHALEEISSFGSLESIASELYIVGNRSLKELDGFPKLESVARSFRVTDNAALSSISGFDGLQSVGGLHFRIIRNHNLESITGFEQLHDVQTRYKMIADNTKFDCTPYSDTSPAYFPLTSSSGNRVNCQ